MLGTAPGSHFDRAGSTRCASTNALVPAVSEVPAFMIAFATDAAAPNPKGHSFPRLSDTHQELAARSMILSGQRFLIVIEIDEHKKKS
jgi:hypothetical protein